MIGALTAEVAELHEQSIKVQDACARYGHTHARDEGNGAQLKAINGKLIAVERVLRSCATRRGYW